MKNDELLHKWVNGDLTSEEFQTFKNRPEYESLKQLYKNTDGLQIPSFKEEKVLKTVLSTEKRTEKMPQQGRLLFLSTWVRYGVAASLLLGAIWFLLGRNANRTIYEVAKAERAEGELPDGSIFILNAESTLTFSTQNWDENRSLSLEGEAFFKVMEGQKFTVNTSQGKVQVIGTQFNVRSRAGQLDVSCQSGKVAVLSTAGTILKTIKPTESVRVVDDIIVEEWAENINESNWIDGVFRFKKATLETVLREIERQFNVRFVETGIDTQTILSCNFQDKNLDAALKTVIGTLPINYTIKNDVIY